MSLPFCFVLMPYGEKPVGSYVVNFDDVYARLIEPAVIEAGMQPIRSDEEQAGGIIHKQMFERLMLCEYAIADVTAVNANVYYELGIRHAVRPHSTVIMFSPGLVQLPFDIALLRALPYGLDHNGNLTSPEQDKASLVGKLQSSKQGETDSPLFSMLSGYPEIESVTSELFEGREQHQEALKRSLREAGQKKQGAVAAISDIQAGMASYDQHDSGTLIQLLDAYRSAEAWTNIVEAVDDFPSRNAKSPAVRQRLAFALNRAGRPDQAEEILLTLISQHGPSGESNGLLGRIYKQKYLEARQRGTGLQSSAFLKRATDTYLDGFRADWHDTYPGVNAITLLACDGGREEELARILPVVKFVALEDAQREPQDYWKHAVLLEIGVIEGDEGSAIAAAGQALTCNPDHWMMETTVDNLKLLNDVLEERDELEPWSRDLEDQFRAEVKRAKEDSHDNG